ncbi:MAG: ADP-glyceromanno-heptose 6-epimerase [Oligoflexia bacterium]|nr:ADP-glyceromanno-heptose 6-epimerase [Oligoflexia bacterium]
MQTYLVTGAAGFIGSAFVESLRGSVSVVSVDRLSHFKSRPEHDRIAMGELVDRDHLWEWLENPSNAKRISAIVHMGACSRTTETDEAFLRQVNVEYSQKLWTFATRKKIPFVYASSAATYGDGTRGYDDVESQIAQLRPLNAYGESKRLFDLWALEEERAGRCPPAWAGFKFFNVYGFGERHKGGMASVVLHAYDQIRERGSVRLFRSHRPDIADGHQTRDFISVEDVVEVLHFALEKPIRRGIFNLGTGHARTYLDLAQVTFKALGREPKIEFIDTPEAIRSKYQYFTEARMDRLRDEGYLKPFISLEEGVRSYLDRLRLLGSSPVKGG